MHRARWRIARWRRVVPLCAAAALLLGLASAAEAATPAERAGEEDRCAIDGCAAGCPCLFNSWDSERRLKFGYGMTAEPRAAAYWYRRAAEAGDARAAYNWGLTLRQGLGVEADPKAARRWLELAAERNVAEALYVLGNLHRRGEGVARNPHKAVQLYRQAAERGHVRSQHALGNMHGNGFGRGADLVTACKWWKIAADKGHVLAAAALLRAEAMMTWPQVLQSRRLAETWQAARRGR